MQKRFALCLLLIFLISFKIFAEDVVIEGTVIDSISHRGISSVNVFLKGTTVGTTTDESGSFKLIIVDSKPQTEVVFKHIAYEVKSISITEIKELKNIVLSKKSIQLREVQVEAERRGHDYIQDITNVISVIPKTAFESKGFVDAADILVTDQSTLVDESLNGRKTVSIRGANQDEVLILYDGVRINNNFDNFFDLSLVDPSGLQQIDIIKGGNVAAFGSFGSSAVINFIPKQEQDYLVRFRQQIGTYNSGDWNLSLYKNLFGVKIFSAMKEATATQQYVGNQQGETDIVHGSSNRTLNISYGFGRRTAGTQKHILRANYLQSNRDYDNQNTLEKLSTSHEIKSIKYVANLNKIGETNILVSDQKGIVSHSWKFFHSDMARQINDNTLQVSVEQVIRLDNIIFFLAYQRENSDLDYQDKMVMEISESSGQDTCAFHRVRSGYSSAVQFINPEISYPFDFDNIQFSLSHERIKDRQFSYSVPETFDMINSDWHESSYMLSTSFVGFPENNLLSAHFNYGSSFRIPTLYQQIISTFYHLNDDLGNKLMMEYKRNLEIGVAISDNHAKATNHYEVTSAIFHNSYRNKFRTIQLSGSPVTFLDNRADASILGFETAASASFLQKLFIFNISFSRYLISEKSAFPFKSDRKLTTSISLNYRGFNLELMWYSEAQRIGWVYIPSGDIQELSLPEFSNIDLHLRKSFEFWRCKCFGSFSGRNLLNKQLILEGIAIRDRRLYFTVGFEFE